MIRQGVSVRDWDAGGSNCNLDGGSIYATSSAQIAFGHIKCYRRSSVIGIRMQRTYKGRVELRPGTFENVSVQAKDLMSARRLMETQYRGLKVISVEEA